MSSLNLYCLHFAEGETEAHRGHLVCKWLSWDSYLVHAGGGKGWRGSDPTWGPPADPGNSMPPRAMIPLGTLGPTGVTHGSMTAFLGEVYFLERFIF